VVVAVVKAAMVAKLLLVLPMVLLELLTQAVEAVAQEQEVLVLNTLAVMAALAS
jgi:hypothetical protein